jgi:hypothetical protein
LDAKIDKKYSGSPSDADSFASDSPSDADSSPLPDLFGDSELFADTSEQEESQKLKKEKQKRKEKNEDDEIGNGSAFSTNESVSAEWETAWGGSTSGWNSWNGWGSDSAGNSSWLESAAAPATTQTVASDSATGEDASENADVNGSENSGSDSHPIDDPGADGSMAVTGAGTGTPPGMPSGSRTLSLESTSPGSDDGVGESHPSCVGSAHPTSNQVTAPIQPAIPPQTTAISGGEGGAGVSVGWESDATSTKGDGNGNATSSKSDASSREKANPAVRPPVRPPLRPPICAPLASSQLSARSGGGGGSTSSHSFSAKKEKIDYSIFSGSANIGSNSISGSNIRSTSISGSNIRSTSISGSSIRSNSINGSNASSSLRPPPRKAKDEIFVPSATPKSAAVARMNAHRTPLTGEVKKQDSDRDSVGARKSLFFEGSHNAPGLLDENSNSDDEYWQLDVGKTQSQVQTGQHTKPGESSSQVRTKEGLTLSQDLKNRNLKAEQTLLAELRAKGRAKGVPRIRNFIGGKTGGFGDHTGRLGDEHAGSCNTRDKRRQAGPDRELRGNLLNGSSGFGGMINDINPFMMLEDVNNGVISKFSNQHRKSAEGSQAKRRRGELAGKKGRAAAMKRELRLLLEKLKPEDLEELGRFETVVKWFAKRKGDARGGENYRDHLNDTVRGVREYLGFLPELEDDDVKKGEFKFLVNQYPRGCISKVSACVLMHPKSW